MSSKPKPNKFAAALKPQQQPAHGGGGAEEETAPDTRSTSPAASSKTAPSRRATKHVGGYFDTAVWKQLKTIALEEDTTIQDLLAEGIDHVFQARRKPTIAKKVTA